MRRALVLLVAGVWLALAGIALSGATNVDRFIPRASAAPLDCSTPPNPATCTSSPTPPTATDTPTSGTTPTTTASPSVTATRTPHRTPTAAPPTATTSDNGGGGGGGGDVGPQPTKVVSQLPSAGDNGGGPLGGLSAGAFGSNGLLLATTSSCIVGLLGLLIAAIALSVLLRGGYGPFLKTLLQGKRAGHERGKGGAKGDLAAASARTSSARNGFGAKPDQYRRDSGGGRSDPRHSREERGPRQGSHARSRSRGAGRDAW